MLYIVATPIGNLEDITYRAVRILKEVDLIACEDTRKSWILLKHYDIKKPLLSFHSYSGQTKLDRIIDKLKEWEDVAVISDAWTPGISDPWYALIQKALSEGVDICPIPWPSAVITALSASGLQSNHFLYLGFLPVKKWRQTLFLRLQEKKDETVVIYESVHRIVRTLWDLAKYFWEDHHIVVGRELTKKFEEFRRWSIKEVLDYFKDTPWKVKGEFVVMF